MMLPFMRQRCAHTHAVAVGYAANRQRAAGKMHIVPHIPGIGSEPPTRRGT